MARSRSKKAGGAQVSSNIKLGVVRLIKKMKKTWLTLLHSRLKKEELDTYLSINDMQSPSHQFHNLYYSSSSYHADDIASCIEFIKRTSAYSSPTPSLSSSSSASVAEAVSSSSTPPPVFSPSSP